MPRCPLPSRMLVLVGLTLSVGCGAGSDAPLDLRTLRLAAADGSWVRPFEASEAAALLFVFVAADCPIANRYAPEIQALAAEVAARGVRTWLVYPDPSETSAGMARHLAEYGYELDALHDPEHELVALCGASVTPEAVVFLPAGTRVYRGRIDDRHVDFGQQRPRATQHDLADALDDVLSGRPVTTPTTTAVGCYIADLR